MTTKKLHRFLISAIPDLPSFVITDQRVVHQITRVLKIKINELFIVFTDRGNDIEVAMIEKRGKELVVEKKGMKEKNAPKRELVAAISIVKGDAFELIVQKLSELGVSIIVPLVASRTVKQGVKKDRLQKISDEAIEQSGGNKRVAITEAMTLGECLATFPFPSVMFQIGVRETTPSLQEKMVMYVGPEGGWSEEDEATLIALNASPLSLGERILRTETAAIVGAYLLLK